MLCTCNVCGKHCFLLYIGSELRRGEGSALPLNSSGKTFHRILFPVQRGIGANEAGLVASGFLFMYLCRESIGHLSIDSLIGTVKLAQRFYGCSTWRWWLEGGGLVHKEALKS